MLKIKILDNVENILLPQLKNWQEIEKIIQIKSNQLLQIAHTTVKTKLHFANMQLNILTQVVNPPSSHSKQFMMRSMFESIIINLVSSLESTAHVINQIYDLGIDYKHITIDHKFYNNEKKHLDAQKNCVRCKVKYANNDLYTFLNNTLKRGSPIDLWYEGLVEYRHQIVHRPHYIALLTADNHEYKGYYIPDDPKILPSGVSFDHKKGISVYKNYTLMREIKQFAETSFSSILNIIEDIYGLILKYEAKDFITKI